MQPGFRYQDIKGIHSFKSIATVSVKVCASDKPMTNFNGALLYLFHISLELPFFHFIFHIYFFIVDRDISRGALLPVNWYGIPNSHPKLIKN